MEHQTKKSDDDGSADAEMDGPESETASATAAALVASIFNIRLSPPGVHSIRTQ